MKCDFTLHHSCVSNNNILKKAIGITIVLFLICLSADQLQAQMFTVGDRGPRFDIPQTEVYLGLEPMDVTYHGGETEQEEAGAFEFEGSVIRLGYAGPGVDFFMGVGGNVTGIDEASYFDAGGNIDFGITIYRNEQITLQLPLRVASRYTNLTNERALQFARLSRFRFGSLTAGAGAKIMARPARNFRLEAGAVPRYGFAFASDGFFGGSLGVMAANGRLYFDRLFGDVGLSLGYNYDLRNYDIDEDRYDYRINGHSFEVGITF